MAPHPVEKSCTQPLLRCPRAMQQRPVALFLHGVVRQFASSNFVMPAEQQLLLTLMKLRLGLVYGNLSRSFGVCTSTAANIFRAMLATLGRILRSVVVWLARDKLQGMLQSPLRRKVLQALLAPWIALKCSYSDQKKCLHEHRRIAHTKTTIQ